MNIDLSALVAKSAMEFGNFVGYDNTLPFYPIAVDVGYSSVKVISPNGRFVFPALVTELSPKDIKGVGLQVFSEGDLRYQDPAKSEQVFYMGNKVRQYIEDYNSTFNEIKFYQRERIFSEEYLILFRTAIFLGLLTADGSLVQDKPIKLVTGLPEEYLLKDSKKLKELLEKRHIYRVAVGNSQFKDIDITLSDVEVISQPVGTYFAIVANFNAQIRKSIFTDNNVLIVDGGFHSIDTFFVRENNTAGVSKTWNHFAMYDIYKSTIQKIYEKTGELITVNRLGMLINHHKHPCVLRRETDRQEYNFTQDLIDSIRENAEELIEELKVTYNNFIDIDTVLLTGGTGKVYYPIFKEKMPVPIELAETDGFDITFTNVLGYYKYLIGVIKSAQQQQS